MSRAQGNRGLKDIEEVSCGAGLGKRGGAGGGRLEGGQGLKTPGFDGKC